MLQLFCAYISVLPVRCRRRDPRADMILLEMRKPSLYGRTHLRPRREESGEDKCRNMISDANVLTVPLPRRSSPDTLVQPPER